MRARVSVCLSVCVFFGGYREAKSKPPTLGFPSFETPMRSKAGQATMPMQLEAVLAKRERAEKEHMPARPPHVFVDGVYVRGWGVVGNRVLRILVPPRDTKRRTHIHIGYPFTHTAHVLTGPADPKQKPLLRHVIVKDLNKERLGLVNPKGLANLAGGHAAQV